MADDRDSYKGQIITLELHEDDVSGLITSVDRIVILQDKEICFQGVPWAPDIDYATGVLVTRGGVDYRCILTHHSATLNAPPNTTYWIPAIIEISPGVWSFSLNTNDVLYLGDFHDRWILDGGSSYVQKSLTISEALSNIPARSSGNYSYYSKDIYFDVQSDGDLYRLYDNNSIAAKIEAVCLTPMGSLYNEPGHGTNLYRYLFRMSPHVDDEIRLELETQIQMQVPQIKISSITVVPNDYNAYLVTINFYNIISSNPNELLSMTNLVAIEGVVS